MSPFKSEAQRRFMYKNHPDIAKRFESETPKGKKLPKHLSKTAMKKLQQMKKKK